MIITISVKEIIGLGIIALMVFALIALYIYYLIDDWRDKRKKKK